MVHTRVALVVLSALGVGATALTTPTKATSLRSDAVEVHSKKKYTQDCWKKIHTPWARHFSMLQMDSPGAGLFPDEMDPYSTVYMDGFLMVSCVKDYMFEHGDKHGDNKFAYEIASTSNVSIVHYLDMVPREDQKKMSHDVCFEFCRTIPEMTYFGITQGRDCYCTPFFEQMAGDSSSCDAVCEGKATQMCGGMKKSSIFAMHKCGVDYRKKEAEATKEALSEILVALPAYAMAVKSIIPADEATALQKALGSAGDPVAADLMQDANVWAGELVHAADDCLAWEKDTKPMEAEVTTAVTAYENEDADFATQAGAEVTLKKAKLAADVGNEKLDSLKDMMELASPEYTALEGVNKSTAQYLPLMYFVDKEHEGVPTTCGGDAIAKPIFNKTKDGCASACDAHVSTCVGFSYFPDGTGICFLFSKFKSATYFTECGATGEEGFLQVAKEIVKRKDLKAECMAKLIHFEGLNIKPDPSGKCEVCLKELTEAKRCF